MAEENKITICQPKQIGKLHDLSPGLFLRRVGVNRVSTPEVMHLNQLFYANQADFLDRTGTPRQVSGRLSQLSASATRPARNGLVSMSPVGRN